MRSSTMPRVLGRLVHVGLTVTAPPCRRVRQSYLTLAPRPSEKPRSIALKEAQFWH
jgi:hypothetical protein